MREISCCKSVWHTYKFLARVNSHEFLVRVSWALQLRAFSHLKCPTYAKNAIETLATVYKVFAEYKSTTDKQRYTYMVLRLVLTAGGGAQPTNGDPNLYVQFPYFNDCLLWHCHWLTATLCSLANVFHLLILTYAAASSNYVVFRLKSNVFTYFIYYAQRR